MIFLSLDEITLITFWIVLHLVCSPQLKEIHVSPLRIPLCSYSQFKMEKKAQRVSLNSRLRFLIIVLCSFEKKERAFVLKKEIVFGAEDVLFLHCLKNCRNKNKVFNVSKSNEGKLK